MIVHGLMLCLFFIQLLILLMCACCVCLWTFAVGTNMPHMACGSQRTACRCHFPPFLPDGFVGSNSGPWVGSKPFYLQRGTTLRVLWFVIWKYVQRTVNHSHDSDQTHHPQISLYSFLSTTDLPSIVANLIVLSRLCTSRFMEYVHSSGFFHNKIWVFNCLSTFYNY